MRTLLADLRSSARSLLSTRGTAVAAVLTLALGTGGNTAVLAVAYGVLLRPLPYGAPNQLVVIDTASARSGSRFGIPLGDVEDWSRQLSGVDGAAAFTGADLTVRGVGEPETLHCQLVSASFFKVLGVPAERGQPFSDSHATTIVVSDRYARRIGAPDALGRKLTVGGEGFEVGAVMPPTFSFPDDSVDLWVPAQSIAALHVLTVADQRVYRLIARRRPTVTLTGLRQEAEQVFRQIHPDQYLVVATVEPLLSLIAGDSPRVLVAFIAAAVLLLIVACANATTLLLSRAAARRHELAVRLALGASPLRLMRAAMVESALLALMGSAGGTLLANACLRALIHAASGSLPRVSAVAIDWPILGTTAVVAVLVTILAGLAPALAAAKTDFAPAFRRTGQSSGTNSARASLVVLQVAAAVLLLTGAGLLGRTVTSLLRGSGGTIAADRVLVTRLLLTEGTRFDARERKPFVDSLLNAVRALPGVTAAGVGSSLPPRSNQILFSVRMINDAGRDDTHSLDLVAATPGYFQALGVRLLKGRLFDAQDEAKGSPVAVLSASAARDLSWTTNPIDHDFTVALPTPTGGGRARPRVIGIVSDVHYTGLDAPADDAIYLLWQSLSTGSSYLVVRSAGDPSALQSAIRSLVPTLDPGLPLGTIRTLEEEMNLAISGRELRLELVSAFAALACAVAFVGLGAVLSRSVAERRQELAIRSALGATPRRVMTLVASEGTRLVIGGLGLGLVAAAASGRWLRSLMAGVSPYDPVTYGLVAVTVIATAAIACYWPAHRAAQIDPLQLLRGE